MKLVSPAISAAMLLLLVNNTPAANDEPRRQILLSGNSWQFSPAGPEAAPPEISADTFEKMQWQGVAVPHVFQTRGQFKDVKQGWYRRSFPIAQELSGRHIYLVFEGAATVADVYVNGRHLGQHRGAYTRFIFDATEAVHPGDGNILAVHVDNDSKDTTDCLPDRSRLYTVWGGLYRKVWMLAVDPLHIDPTDHASPGVYITPGTDGTGDLSLEILLRNASAVAQNAGVRATAIDPAGAVMGTFDGNISVPAAGRAVLELKGSLAHPKLWSPASPNLYHVRVEVLRDGKVVDEITQPAGFRTLVFDKGGRVTLNGSPFILLGSNLHQEIESKASAMSDDDFRADYAFMRDLGFNFIRLSHYPHAQLEYDLCDQLGIFCWAENGHSNKDMPGPTADEITTELVKQNYNHPSIVVWSVGNEAGEEVAEREVSVVKALDPSRPVAVANMKCANADFHGINSYPGWYGGGAAFWKFSPHGFVTETGAGGVTTIHCDYADARHKTNKYEPEEYQQLVAEARFQEMVKENDGTHGMFAWWTMRDITDDKYKKPIGWNTKGLLTYAGDRKDIYYLYRCFLRPDEPTVHITSQRYFLRTGAVNNGIKAYSSAARLTLTLNGEKISPLENGGYTQQASGRRIDNVFYWPVPLRTGKNVATVSDGAGHADSAVIYFYGAGGLPELPVQNPLVTDLQTSNPANKAYFMDMPAQAQWPLYYDLDSTADNSFDALPAEIEGAKWIAMRRVTKQGQESGLSFKLARPATVFVVRTKTGAIPPSLSASGFKEISSPGFVWRDNDLMLVPAQIFSRKAAPGEVIHLDRSDQDQIVLLKE